MRKLCNRIVRGLALVAALAPVTAGAPAALAETYFTWTTEDGVRAFTDDYKRVPARYRSVAEERTRRSLRDFDRFTPVSGAADVVARRAAAAQPLPAVSAAPPAVTGMGPGITLDLDGTELNLPASESHEPYVVDHVRMTMPGSAATRTVQVVRQGDKVIAVIRPRANETTAGAEPSEASLFE